MLLVFVQTASFNMDLLQNATDDQIAIAGSIFALLFTGGMMYVSFFIGQNGGTETQTRSIPLETRRPSNPAESERKAA